MSYKRYSLWNAVFIATFLVLGCQTAPKAVDASADELQWESRLRIKDVKKNKTQSVSADVLARKSSGEIRIEMSSLAIPLASYVMDAKGFSCALYRQKAFYEGPLKENALQPLLRMPLSPVLFRQMLFDRPMSGGDWACKKGADGLVASCSSAQRQLAVVWERKPESRTVRVTHPGFEIHWVFNPPSTEVQFKENTFRLEAPRGFKVIRL
ncbi:MAG TPA: hypothetical protein PL182_00510 [Pseudobdellovibrionaceae bacterium]|nr:hypothetical protein [Pseudobdellovibrionaceae bacterium]